MLKIIFTCLKIRATERENLKLLCKLESDIILDHHKLKLKMTTVNKHSLFLQYKRINTTDINTWAAQTVTYVLE